MTGARQARPTRIGPLPAPVLALALVLGCALLPLTAGDGDGASGTYDFSDAVEGASAGDTVVVDSDWTLTRDVTVPEGVTVVFACFDGDTGYVDGMNPSGTLEADKHLHLTVTVPEGVTLTVKGTVLVNAVTCQPVWYCDLKITGGYALVVNEGSIVVADGGLYDNFGETEGGGLAEVMPGGTLRDRYTISHWRGGTAAMAAYQNGIYPINEYSMRSVTCDIRVWSGGSYTATVKLYVNGSFRFAVFPQIDNDNGLIRLPEEAYVDRSWSNYRSSYTFHGGAEFSGSSLNLGVATLHTSSVVFPLNGCVSMTLTDGVYTVSEDFKVLPGASVTLSNAELVVSEGASLSVYDYFDDMTSWTGTEYPSERAPAYLHLTNGSTLRVEGSFGGRVFLDGTSALETGENAVLHTETGEVYGEDGWWTSHHYTVLIYGEPSRYIEWYCTDPGLTEEWDGSELDALQALYSAATDSDAAEDKLREASVGGFVESSEDDAPILLAAIAAAVALIAAALVVRRRRSRSRGAPRGMRRTPTGPLRACPDAEAIMPFRRPLVSRASSRSHRTSPPRPRMSRLTHIYYQPSRRFRMCDLHASEPSPEPPDYASYSRDGRILIRCPPDFTGTFEIPDGVRHIGEGAFEGCDRLKYVTIPDGVECIGEGAFEGCDRLKYVTIPDGVECIDTNAFRGCSSLRFVKIPDSVECIGMDAFRGCRMLNSVHIGDGVKSIGFGAFEGCDRLRFVKIPDGVVWVGEGAFDGCSSLVSITVGPENTSYSSDAQGALYSKDGRELICCPEGFSGSFVVPDGVKRIGYSAFEGCESLTSVHIGDDVKSVKDGAFFGCKSLASVHIGDNVKSIGDGMFNGCSSLTSIKIPDSVSWIGDAAFFDCESLGSVHFGKSVKSIGEGAFELCTSLKSVTIPKSVASIGEAAFNGCSSLTSIKIPNSVEWIGDEAFDGCSSLESISVARSNAAYSSDGQGALYDKERTELVRCPCGFTGSFTIPNGVESILGNAFCECRSLTSVAIPDSVEHIGFDAFRRCGMLASVTIPDRVRCIDRNVFDECPTLKSISVGPGNAAYSSDAQGALYDQNGAKLVRCPCGFSGTFTIPDEVEWIEDDAFDGCSSLESISVGPNSTAYSSDGQGALYSKDGTELVRCPCKFSGTFTIPDGVVRARGNAFDRCMGVTSVTVPDSLTTIGYQRIGCTPWPEMMTAGGRTITPEDIERRRGD